MSRRWPYRLRVMLLAVVLVGLAGTGWAGPVERFPSREITLIVPWPAGGGSDIAMRLLAERARVHFGVPVVVVNRPGAAGAIGHREIANATPDGYTIGMFGSGFIAQQYMIPNPTLIDEIQPLAFFGLDPGALTVRGETPWRTLRDFVTAAKAAPNTIRNANDPPGGGSHLTVLMIERRLGIHLIKVPYAGFAPSVVAMLGGETQSTTIPVPDVIEVHKAGKARILGVMGDERHFLAPDVPTFKEQGFDVVYGTWRTLAAPKGIPSDRLTVLEEKLLTTLRDERFIDRARRAGFIVSPKSLRLTEAYLKAEDALIYSILLELGLVRTPR
ncbi:MAG: tripartite tricarboxylate transporter substrate binding protein [bacterium]|nr:tripartite tricarboxylate transporter substrate binding protein [bacterium]